MTKLIWPISLVFIVGLFSYSQSKTDNIQSFEITYIKAFKKFDDTTSNDPKILKDLEYVLKCNKEEAIFNYVPSMTNDGVKSNKRFIGRGGGKGIYYKNLLDEEKYRQVEVDDGNNYLIKEDFNKYKWELLRDTKEILGYKCFKAIGTYVEYSNFLKKNNTINVVVWYTPEIPLPFGPGGYDGLPGLVLESSRSSFHLIASDIKTSSKTKKIKRPDKGEEVTDEQYNKIIHENWLKLTGRN